MPDNSLIYKAGLQSDSDPWEFVMSDPTPDSYGDIVEASWKLGRFRKNPIALWMHSGGLPIGTWRNVRVEEDRLRGRLELAKEGISPRIDELRALVGEKIVRAVSVGFRPGKEEPLDPEKPWNGYRLSENELLECSLVSVPANPNALNTKGVVGDNTKLGEIDRCYLSAFEQLKGEGSSRIYVPKTYSLNSDRGSKMKLSDRIKQKLAEIEALQDKIDAFETAGFPEDQMGEMDTVKDEMARARKSLATLEGLEQVRGTDVVGGQPDPAPAEPHRVQRIASRQPREKGHLAMMSVACMLKSFATKRDPLGIAATEAKDEEGLDIVLRAATAPAVTGTAAWAGNLVEQTWGDFIALLRDVSIYAQAPGERISIVNGVINRPVQGGRGNLAAGFVGENGVAPVKVGAITLLTMQPCPMAVISAHSKEILRRSTPESIASIIRDQFLADTAEYIDTFLLGTTARSAGTNPAGLQDTTETGAANVNAVTNAATGAGNSTVAEINGDVQALLGRVDAVKASRTGAWLMNPTQVRGLLIKQEATTGQFVFKDEVSNGKFFNYPIIPSTNVTNGVVAFIGQDAMAFGEDLTPTFDESTDATLHFENTTPLAIGTTGTPNTVAAPAINLFQQNLVAIRMNLSLDWRVKRQAGVQILTAATGW